MSLQCRSWKHFIEELTESQPSGIHLPWHTSHTSIQAAPHTLQHQAVQQRGRFERDIPFHMFKHGPLHKHCRSHTENELSSPHPKEVTIALDALTAQLLPNLTLRSYRS